jgi:FAD binding domain/Berberine and berberine like
LTLRRCNGAAVDETAIETFKQGFYGQALWPGDAGYDSARRIWNASIDMHPGLIARCSDTADVVRAVQSARANELLVAVRSGGHNVAGRALCDHGIVIDLSAMNGISVDPELHAVRVQAGALLGDVDRETHPHGLAVPVGTVSKTGIAGLTLGGGFGWLSRKYGLTCDNVISCEVVTAEGEIVTADADKHVDLFWGLRGGGGNFGIVTSFLYRAHPVSTVLGGLVVHARGQATAVLRYYRDFMAYAPEELTAYASLITTPDGTPAVGVMVCYCGKVIEGEAILKPLRAFGSPIVDTIQRMPFPAMQRLADDTYPDNIYNYWKSTFLKELSDEAIDLIIEHGNRSESLLSNITIQLYGGAVSRVGDADTAFAQRQAEYNVAIEAKWTDPAESRKHIGWTRAFSEALKPYSSNAYLLNFLGNEGRDLVRAAFGSNYTQLAELKAKYDPTNFFSLNQNVQPPPAEKARGTGYEGRVSCAE